MRKRIINKGTKPVQRKEGSYNPLQNWVPLAARSTLKIARDNINNGQNTGNTSSFFTGSRKLVKVAESCRAASTDEKNRGNFERAEEYEKTAMELFNDASGYFMQAGRKKDAINVLKKAGVKTPKEHLRQELGWDI